MVAIKITDNEYKVLHVGRSYIFVLVTKRFIDDTMLIPPILIRVNEMLLVTVMHYVFLVRDNISDVCYGFVLVEVCNVCLTETSSTASV